MGVRHMQGTPAHIETLHIKDEKRHRSKCVYYVSDTNRCIYQSTKCVGSAHCDFYKTGKKPSSFIFTKKNGKAVTISKGNRVSHVKYGDGIVKNIRLSDDANYDGCVAEIQFQGSKESLVSIKIPAALLSGNLMLKSSAAITPKTKIHIKTTVTSGNKPKLKVVKTVENSLGKKKKRKKRKKKSHLTTFPTGLIT